MTCREVIDFLMEYLDGGLPAAQRAEFERHLGVCPSCVNYLESYRKTIELGRAALLNSDEPVPRAVPEGLVKAILAASRRSQPSP